MDENDAVPHRGEGEVPIPEFSSLPRQVCFISAPSGTSKDSRLSAQVVDRLFRLAAKRSGIVLDPKSEQLERAVDQLPPDVGLYFYGSR